MFEEQELSEENNEEERELTDDELQAECMIQRAMIARQQENQERLIAAAVAVAKRDEEILTGLERIFKSAASGGEFVTELRMLFGRERLSLSRAKKIFLLI